MPSSARSRSIGRARWSSASARTRRSTGWSSFPPTTRTGRRCRRSSPASSRTPRSSSRPSAGPSPATTAWRPTTCSTPTPAGKWRPAGARCCSRATATCSSALRRMSASSTRVVAGVEEMGPSEVKKRYGIPPKLVPDFIALRGDPSDGIPGAKGVGEKTAAELLREHGSLEGVLDAAFRERRLSSADGADGVARRAARLQGGRNPAGGERPAPARQANELRLGGKGRPAARDEATGRAAGARGSEVGRSLTIAMAATGPAVNG